MRRHKMRRREGVRRREVWWCSFVCVSVLLSTIDDLLRHCIGMTVTSTIFLRTTHSDLNIIGLKIGLALESTCGCSTNITSIKDHDDVQMLSKMTLTPHAPGSGTCERRSLSTSIYALRPARAATCFVFSAACTAASRAAGKDPRPAGGGCNVEIKASRGSTSVREGGRARV